MRWSELFGIDQVPSLEDMRSFIGDAQSYWDDLVLYLEDTYVPKHHLDYSKDTLQPGWNLKFKKNGKTLCTLYPMENYFIALVVIGPKEEDAVRQDMEAGLFTSYVQRLYDQTVYSVLGRWLMIEVKDGSVLKDIYHLVTIRSTPRSQNKKDSKHENP